MSRRYGTLIAMIDARPDVGPEADWSETWDMDFASADGSVAGYLRLTMFPNLGTSWVWSAVAGGGRTTVAMLENEAPVPPGPGMELRTSGLWVDVIPQTAGEHLTLGLEAFGVGFEDPSEIYRTGYGDRTPMGFDLEWETAESHGHDAALPCVVHGEILLADEEIDFDGRGWRRHWSGSKRWWTDPYPDFFGWIDDEPSLALVRNIELDENGLPLVAELEANREGHEAETLLADAIAWAPAEVEAPGGASVRFPRTLCRVGDRGLGWLDVRQASSG